MEKLKRIFNETVNQYSEPFSRYFSVAECSANIFYDFLIEKLIPLLQRTNFKAELPHFSKSKLGILYNFSEFRRYLARHCHSIDSEMTSLHQKFYFLVLENCKIWYSEVLDQCSSWIEGFIIQEGTLSQSKIKISEKLRELSRAKSQCESENMNIEPGPCENNSHNANNHLDLEANLWL